MKDMTNMSIKVETMTETKTKKEETPNVQEKVVSKYWDYLRQP